MRSRSLSNDGPRMVSPTTPERGSQLRPGIAPSITCAVNVGMRTSSQCSSAKLGLLGEVRRGTDLMAPIR